MDQGYHYEGPSVRSNHNENMLLLKEGDLGYPQVNMWLNWEAYLLLFNMGHMIYVLDQFFDVNSKAVSIL